VNFAIPLLAAALAAPPPAELDALLKAEPIATNWSAWNGRFKEWSNDNYDAAQPAFRAGFEYVMRVSKTNPKGRSLPKDLSTSAVANMLLAGALVDEARTGGNIGKGAVDIARQAIKLDDSLAPAHFYLFRALVTNPKQAADAFAELRKAETLGPTVAWMPMEESGKLALDFKQWPEAERRFALALKAKPDDIELARKYARAVGAQKGLTNPNAAERIDPLLQQFGDDPVLLVYRGQALAHSGQKDEAALEFLKARSLKIEPADVIDSKFVNDIVNDHKRRETDAARKQREATQRAEDRQREQTRREVEDRRDQAMQAAQAAAAERPWLMLRWIGTFALAFALFYGAVMLLMCLMGVVLARRSDGILHKELLETSDLVDNGKVVRSTRELKTGRFYLLVMLIALVLFYVSLPIVFTGLLLVFLPLIFFARTRSNSLIYATGGSIGALFKAAFATPRISNFGKQLEPEDAPKLFRAIDEVADRVDTEAPDEVWLSPGSEFSVYQIGRGPFGAFGGKRRVLTVGLCVMNFLTVAEFKSILAHEFAHFSHADTFWSRFLYQVTLSLNVASYEMARTGGFITYVNPFYWFFRLYGKSYSLLSAGFSRSREYLADRMACLLYGSDVFTSALQKVCTDGSHFETVVYDNIRKLLRDNKSFVNMYLAFRKHREQNMSEAKLKKLHKELLDRPKSLFASHPTFAERAEAAKSIPAAKVKQSPASLKLFEDAEQMEREMTDYLTEKMSSF
jgi:Zn-dependent protease with chaperone function